MILIGVSGLITFHLTNAFYFLNLRAHPSGCSPLKYRFLGLSLSIPQPCEKPVESLELSTGALRGVGYITRYLISPVNHYTFPKLSPGQNLSLFRRSDLLTRDHRGWEEMERELLPRIKRVRESLTSRGVKVVMLPLPSKIDVQWENVPHPAPPLSIFETSRERRLVSAAELEAKYDFFSAYDQPYNVNLYQPYRSAFVKDPSLATYIPWGFHWTSYGIALAATSILQNLKTQGVAVSDIKTVYVDTADKFLPELLLNTFQLPHFFIQRRPEFKWREPRYRISADASLGQEIDRVVIIADSNGERLRENKLSLGELLSETLHRPLVDLSFGGVGGVGVLLDTAQKGFEFHPRDLVVFEFQVPSEFSAETESQIYLKVTPAPDRTISGE